MRSPGPMDSSAMRYTRGAQSLNGNSAKTYIPFFTTAGGGARRVREHTHTHTSEAYGWLWSAGYNITPHLYDDHQALHALAHDRECSVCVHYN